jgi:hypothetical protein
MAARTDHLWIDRTHLGREFPDVHRWLDELYLLFGGLHREKRHHREAVEEIRAKWGDEAAKAGELHLLLDMGHIPTKEQWEKRTSFTMDAMGRRVEYLQRFGHHADDRANSVAFTTTMRCKDCQVETEQRLFDVRAGRFYCSRCGAVNHDLGYRLDKQPRY